MRTRIPAAAQQSKTRAAGVIDPTHSSRLSWTARDRVSLVGRAEVVTLRLSELNGPIREPLTKIFDSSKKISRPADRARESGLQPTSNPHQRCDAKISQESA